MAIELSAEYAGRLPDAERERLMSDPSFGRVFTEHMITISWTEDLGWHDGRLRPYGPLPMDPSAQVFHYGQEVFEALKAFRQAGGSVAIFRPRENAKRLAMSCERMAMPSLPEETFVAAIDMLVTADQAWVPSQPGHSLYLRPFMIATEASLSFYRSAAEYMFVVIASPAGVYFKGGPEPVTVWVERDYVRAVAGGTGAAKCGGNYGGTLLAMRQAAQQGCDQVVWLDAVEHRWVEEMGTSNIFFVYGSRLLTPRLDGALLAGVTRASLLKMARDLGYEAEESPISVEQWRADAGAGHLTEVFSSGTSSMVTPVGRVKTAEDEWVIGDGRPGKVTMRLREELMGIQSGERPDLHGWMHHVL